MSILPWRTPRDTDYGKLAQAAARLREQLQAVIEYDHRTPYPVDRVPIAKAAIVPHLKAMLDAVKPGSPEAKRIGFIRDAFENLLDGERERTIPPGVRLVTFARTHVPIVETIGTEAVRKAQASGPGGK
jgi:hypothetical protein